MDKSCEWEGTLDLLDQHVASCEESSVPCPKQCKNSNNEIQQYSRKDLDTHLEKACPNRDYICRYCGEKGTYASISVHDRVCEKKILPCSNAECGNTMERREFIEHVRTQCPYTVIWCKYKGFGCTSRLKRRDMAAHEEDDKLHLHMALDTVNVLQDTVMGFKSKESMTFEFPEYQASNDGNKTFISPSFYTSPKGYHMEVRVHTNGSGAGLGTHLSISAHIKEGENDAGLKWPFKGKVTFTLLNQLEDENHRTATLAVDDVWHNWELPQFVPHAALALDPVKNTQYLVDNTLYFRVSVEVADHKPWLQCTAK